MKTCTFFLVTLFIAYLPVSSFLFFLKNDAFNGYFPPKFFMSESISSGYLPLWNPYINFGLPQYGDMSSGYWSPVTWLIASTTGYTAYTFTAELLFYILAAGVGMYLFCRRLGLSKHVCMLAGVAYMCSGYMVGHLQHFNWISGAAFLPWCLWAYNRMQLSFSVNSLLIASLCFFMLAASAHPGIIIGSMYFFTAYAVFSFFNRQQSLSASAYTKRFMWGNLLLLTCIALLSAGMIAGYSDLIPHITRGEKIHTGAAITNPFSAASSISALLPLSTVKNDKLFITDISMRNIYFGITLLLFFLVALVSKKNRFQKFLLTSGILFLLVSTTGFIKANAYEYLPLIGYVRMNGEFAIFALMCFIIMAAISLDIYFRETGTFSGALKSWYYVLELACFAAIIGGFYLAYQHHESIYYRYSPVSAAAGIPGKLKAMIDALSFYDCLWMQGSFQLFILWLVKWGLIRKKIKWVTVVAVADMVIACLLNIPFTGVGKASVAEVQSVLDKSPNGIIIPPLKPVNRYDSISVYETGLVGNWSFYNKQPGVNRFAFYPVELRSSKLVFAGDTSLCAEKPFLFTETGNNHDNIIVNKFTGNNITATVYTRENGRLVLQQNLYPHWYVVNGNKKTGVWEYKQVFLSAPIAAGYNKVEFHFDPVPVKRAMLLSAVTFLLFSLILIVKYIRRTYLSWLRR